MTATPAPASLRTRRIAPTTRRWGPAQWLALLGAPVLAWEAWTVVAWLSDGPRQVTEFRDTGSASWWAARVLEGGVILLSIPMAVLVVRGCLRERRLTFDAMFCLVAPTMIWADLGVNFFGPTFLFSSNFVNVTNACGHMPGVINPDCGRAPDPVLFLGLMYAFGLLAMAMLAERPFRWAKARWPAASNLRLLALVLVVAIPVDLAIEFSAISLKLWTYTSPSWMSLDFGSGLRFAAPEAFAGASLIAGAIALRLFRDDQGRTIAERGTNHLRPARRAAVTMLALYATFQFIVWIPASLPDMAYGPYETPWPKMEPALLNDVCDAPGVSGTRYGTCPGDPGYRMPGPGSLPGESP